MNDWAFSSGVLSEETVWAADSALLWRQKQQDSRFPPPPSCIPKSNNLKMECKKVAKNGLS